MKFEKKYLYLIVLGVLTLSTFFHIGDYCLGALNTFFSIVFSVLFLASFLIISFYNLYKISIKEERFNFTPLILFLFFSILILITSNYPDVYLLKTRTHIYKSINKANVKSEELILFSNATFETRGVLEKNFCIKKGNYYFKNDSLYLTYTNKKPKDFHFDKVYYSNSKEDLLIPKTNTLPIFKLEQ